MLNNLLPIALGALIAAALPDTGASRRATFDADDVLAKMRAAYAALASYADSGTVLNDTGGYTDRSTFRTLFTRDPSNLLVEYRAIASEYPNVKVPLNHHLVLWLDKGDLQTWSSSSQAHETYPAAGGKQVNALKGSGTFTSGSSVLVTSHLYSKAGIPSAVHATEEAEADGFETVNGRRCYRINGVERWRYPSGQVTGVRPITIWVDAETYLMHKVLQDTPRGMPRNEIRRQTTTIKHRANPELAPEQFRYEVPAS